jgi:hypothetical protein
MNTYVAIVIVVLMTLIYIVYQLIRQNTANSGESLCSGGATYSNRCVIPIGYKYDATGGSQLVSNAFRGGSELPLQLMGSTFDGDMYSWSGTTQGDRLWGIDRLDGLSNGITAITWGADHNGNIGLAGKTTVEQCTGYGPIINSNNPTDYSCGWECGVIYMSDKTNPVITDYSRYVFIHIFKIDIDTTGTYNMPAKFRMWECIVDSEQKSYTYINQLKNNITASVIFGPGAKFADQPTTSLYIPPSPKYNLFYIKMNYDSTRGVDVPDSSRWVNKSVGFPGIFAGTMPR